MKKLFATSNQQKHDGRASSASTASSSADMMSTADAQQQAAALAFAADHLTDAQKRGLAGLCACLLPHVHDGSTSLQWSKQYLQLVVEHFLHLPSSQVDAYLPMLTSQAEAEAPQSHLKKSASDDNNSRELQPVISPAPFLELLAPVKASKRENFKAFFKKKKKDDMFASNQPKSPSSSTGEGHQPQSPTLVTKEAFRLKILKKQLWFTVKSIGYDARARVLLRRLADVMDIEWELVTFEEVLIGRALFAEATAMPLEKATAKLNVWDWKRNVAIGAAAVTGGALLAITGGLAAPAIAASLTALGGAGVAIGTVVGSTAGVTAATILFGTAGAGVVGMKTDTRTRGVHEFSFDLVSSGDGMNVYICISGWLDEDDPPAEKGFRRSWGDSREYLRAFYRTKNAEKVDQVDQVMDRYKGREGEFFGILRKTYSIKADALTHSEISDPLRMLGESRAASYASGNSVGPHTAEAMRAWRWKDRFHQGDQYVLLWEEALLRRFGKSMRSFAKEQVMTYANAEIVKYTALAALFAAVAIPRTILKLADMIDNVWVLAMNTADESGKLLAQALQKREQGLRPVTLVGYGMGARLIFSCLKELAKKPDECCGIVENAVLLGSPVPGANNDWKNARRVVAGRLINGFSENDWMLGVMYRYQGWALNSAGIAAINVHGVENVNLSSVISGHMEYKNKIGVVMDLLNLDS
ncbi:hypothetical protein Gpo141_00002527 [Globisporangium polare]